MNVKRKIEGGLYLVVDPSLGKEYVLPRVEASLKGGVDIVQIWNKWQPDQDKEEFIVTMCSLVHSHDKPVLIHDSWEWLRLSPLDGVHFDAIPDDWDNLKSFLGRSFLAGITCGNDRVRIQWAIDQHLDYISFCAMFPSSSSATCEIVQPDTVRDTRKATAIPIFASGGITPDNTRQLVAMGVDGVAVISGVLKADDPMKAAETYKKNLVLQNQV